MKTLLIVESPAKAKKIQQLLGTNYIVKACMGHIRDLNPKNMSIDLNNNYNPEYQIMDDKKKIVSELRGYVKNVDKVLLCADPDNSGENIAYHLAIVLNLDLKDNIRAVYQEITKKAITNAINNPKQLNMNQALSYQTQRVVDRIVGYSISPILWKTIAGAISAGRVQSVAVKMILEREKEIRQFSNSCVYKTTGIFNENLNGTLNTDFNDLETARKFLLDCIKAVFKIADITKTNTKRKPQPPFTTSTLQQECGSRFNLSAKQTMQIAQKLYETGKITYMRTDSVALSEEAKEDIKAVILEEYGQDYLDIKDFKNKIKNAQEAHEAIRPTHHTEKELDTTFNELEKKIYNIIWKRTVASQMKPAEIEINTLIINISTRKELFKCVKEKILFDGYLSIYQEIKEETEDIDTGDFSSYSVGQIINRTNITTQQKYKQPPLRYTEPQLIKKLEESGIGRPSTYATIVSVIQEREYTKKETLKGEKKSIEILTLKGDKISVKTKEQVIGGEKNKLVITHIGEQVVEFLDANFVEIMDYHFTANLEKEMDKIAQGKKLWHETVDKVYKIIEPKITELSKKESIKKYKETKERILNDDIKVRITKNGPAIQQGTNIYVSITEEEYNTMNLETALQKLQEKKEEMYEGKKISISNGKYGWYAKYGEIIVSLSTGEESLEEIIEKIKEKQENQTQIKLGKKVFIIRKGQYGWYMNYNKKNYPLGKLAEKAPNLTPEECESLIKKVK